MVKRVDGDDDEQQPPVVGPRLLQFPKDDVDRELVRLLVDLTEMAHRGQVIGIVVVAALAPSGIECHTKGVLGEGDIIRSLAAVDVMRDELHVIRRALQSTCDEGGHDDEE